MFFGQKDIKIKARMIAKASGFLGSCKEYFDNTLDSLSELNITDTEMRAIANYFEKIKQKNTIKVFKLLYSFPFFRKSI